MSIYEEPYDDAYLEEEDDEGVTAEDCCRSFAAIKSFMHLLQKPKMRIGNTLLS